MTSIIKVDNLQNQCGANIISESANVITIGASGDTVTLAAGASQSGFGRSGSVNWDTTPKTSSPVTAVSGNGYFINTTSGAITVNLPATPAAGDIVAIADYNGTALTNNITVGRNSSNINGSATDLTINANYSAVTLVYVNSTSGWRSVDSSNPNDIETLPEYVAATGGTITTCGNYKIHSFTGPGTFTVTCAGNPLGSSSVDYLVIAGGGSGGSRRCSGCTSAGGGGAGGYRFSNGTASGSYSAGPAPLGASALPVTATAYPITIGAGGTAKTSPGGNGNVGSPSIFSTITSTGGGGGGGDGDTTTGLPGGSGGGGSGVAGGLTGGSGNTPPVSPPQGNPGFNSTSPPTAGGGGGAGTGGPATGPVNGGNGLASSINGTPTTRTGGGGAVTGSGGTGGGGAGAPSGPGTGVAGTTNTGSGGGGGGLGGSGGSGAGGSGIVVIRYRFQ
jgi:hypothetical protein